MATKKRIFCAIQMKMQRTMQNVLLFLNLCEDEEKCKDAERKKGTKNRLKKRKKEKLNIENFLGDTFLQD